ncbi:hypothetical protein MSPP1_002627 [Malassezia sp. CBS 17886]|nr:hypothetical protein MSPP1_002627 [Malassezia sp. CBS 17886]
MWRQLWEWFLSVFFAKHLDVCIVGLADAGKTTLASVLVNNQFPEQTAPTVGYDLREAQAGNVHIKLWDIGGQPRFRAMWERYCAGASALIFVVDASVPLPHEGEDCAEQWTIAAEELHALAASPSLAGTPILVLATKCDLPNPATTQEVIDTLRLSSLTAREVYCYSVSSRNRTNMDVTVRWLCARAV